MSTASAAGPSHFQPGQPPIVYPHLMAAAAKPAPTSKTFEPMTLEEWGNTPDPTIKTKAQNELITRVFKNFAVAVGVWMKGVVSRFPQIGGTGDPHAIGRTNYYVALHLSTKNLFQLALSMEEEQLKTLMQKLNSLADKLKRSSTVADTTFPTDKEALSLVFEQIPLMTFVKIMRVSLKALFKNTNVPETQQNSEIDSVCARFEAILIRNSNPATTHGPLKALVTAKL